MKHDRIVRTVVPVAICGALGLALLGASGDPTTPADTQFASHAMPLLLQSVANANPAESGGDATVKALASKVQSDEVSIGTQLVSIAGYYGIKVSTDSPKPSIQASDYTASQATVLPQLITLFEQEAKGGGGAQMRSFAETSVPVLEGDLKAVQQAR